MMNKSARQKIHQLAFTARLLGIEIREVFLEKKDYTQLMGNCHTYKKLKEVPDKPGVIKVSLTKWE